MTIQLPQPMTTVLGSLASHEVRYLLMGGQACVIYGASEFSRDIDVAVYAHPDNLNRLDSALESLRATVIAVPPYTPEVLARGHAVHFRCAEAGDIRLDVMSVMRNVPPFDVCWDRRSILPVEQVGGLHVMGIQDLVTAKKTRRDKDWPVVRRLVDVHYRDYGGEPTASRLDFWLRELRTPEALLDCVRRAPDAAREVAVDREATALAAQAVAAQAVLGRATSEAIQRALRAEEERERIADDEYWRPLLAELETMRRARRHGRA